MFSSRIWLERVNTSANEQLGPGEGVLRRVDPDLVALHVVDAAVERVAGDVQEEDSLLVAQVSRANSGKIL